MSHYQPLLEQLKQLRLGGLVDSLELRLKEAEKQQLSDLDFLSLLIQDELQRRSQSKFARRLKKACFADLKTLEEFDFKFNPALERRRPVVPAGGATGGYRAGHPLRLRTQVRRLAQWRSRTAHRKSALLQSHSGGGYRQPSFGLVSGVQSVASLAARTALLEGPEGPSNFPGGNCLGKLFPSKTNKTRERRDDDDSQSGGITLVTGWGIYLGD